MKLHIPHRSIDAVSCQELVVLALFGNRPVLKDDNVVCVANRSEPMGNHQYGSMLSETIESLLNGLFRQSIHCAEGKISAKIGPYGIL